MPTRLALFGVLLLSQLSWAQPTIESKDLNSDGWPEWVAGQESAPSPGYLVTKFASQASTEWLKTQCERFPQSKMAHAALARRLWQDGQQEESLVVWRAAQELADSDLLIESASYAYAAGNIGEAVETLQQMGPSWAKNYGAILKVRPELSRLFASGWDFNEDGILSKDGSLLEFQAAPKEGKESISLHSKDRIQIDSLGAAIKVYPPKERDKVASQIANGKAVTETLGHSVENRPIELILFGEGEETVVFFGAFHGDEPESVDVVKQFADHLSQHPELLEGKRAVIVPVVNPDGLERGTRKNANEVDLNRNYPTTNWNSEGKDTDYWGGSAPASEPETKIVVDLLERFKPSRIISVHCPYRCVNYDGPAEELAKIMSEENGYKVEPSIGYPTPGSFGTYAGIERKIPTITLELPPTGTEDVWKDNKQAFIRAFLGK